MLPPESLILLPCMLSSELIPYLLKVLRLLGPYVVMLYWFQKIL